MGLLDELRNQSDNQRAAEEAEAAGIANREQYYEQQILPRMVKAYQFFKELVEHLNYINLDTMVNYPIMADGHFKPLRQQDYKVVIDSSKTLKQIDVTFQCVLDSPVSYEMYHPDGIRNTTERLDRYYIKYERKDKKNQQMQVILSRFTVEGPLPLKVGLAVDVEKSEIKLLLRNFVEPGTEQHILKAEQLDEAFLDRLGKYILRQERHLFGATATASTTTISDDARERIRQQVLAEQQQREQELREAEEQARLEEEQRKQTSKKAQVASAVNAKVEEKKDKLKDMFNRLKVQAGFDKPS